MRTQSILIGSLIVAVCLCAGRAPGRTVRTGDAPCDLVSEFDGSGGWVGADCADYCGGINDCHVITIKAVSNGQQTRYFYCSACDGGPPTWNDCHGTAFFNLTTGVGGASCAGSCSGGSVCAGFWDISATHFSCQCF